MKARDICIFLCMVAYVFLGAAFTIMEYTQPITEVSVDIQEPIIEITETIDPAKEFRDKMYVHMQLMACKRDTMPISCNKEVNPDDYTCLFYATESIGRYYITAYNHLETGSKITASGKTVHEGTVSTCAADPRYHKFGDILEIDGRLYVVEDTGSAVKKKHIDLYFASYKDMARYGSNYQTIYKVTFPFGRPKYD